MPGRCRRLVLCGPGNNGGDGRVIARELAARGGRRCGSATLGDRSAAEPAPLLIDALFGTGLSRPLEAASRSACSTSPPRPRVRVAIDLPSGVATDDGAILSPVPDYDLTITFQTLKPSHLLQPAARHMGRIVVADIGIPAASNLAEIGPADAARARPRRPQIQPRLCRRARRRDARRERARRRRGAAGRRGLCPADRRAHRRRRPERDRPGPRRCGDAARRPADRRRRSSARAWAGATDLVDASRSPPAGRWCSTPARCASAAERDPDAARGRVRPALPRPSRQQGRARPRGGRGERRGDRLQGRRHGRRRARRPRRDRAARAGLARHARAPATSSPASSPPAARRSAIRSRPPAQAVWLHGRAAERAGPGLIADDLVRQLCERQRSEIVRLAARGDGVTESGRFVPMTAPGDLVAADGASRPGRTIRSRPAAISPSAAAASSSMSTTRPMPITSRTGSPRRSPRRAWPRPTSSRRISRRRAAAAGRR